MINYLNIRKTPLILKQFFRSYLLLALFSLPAMVHGQELEMKGIKWDTSFALKLVDSANQVMNSNYFQAINLGKKALRVSDSLDFNKGKSRSHRSLSFGYDYSGQYSRSQMHNFAYLELEEKAGNKAGMAEAHNFIGIIYYYQGKFEKALEHYQEAKRWYREINDKAGLSACLNNIANLHADNGAHEVGLRYYRKALDIDRELKDTSGMSIAWSNIGETYLVMDEFQQAEESLKKSLQYARKGGDKWEISNPLAALGALWNRTGNYQKALDVLHEALDITRELGAIGEQSEIYKTIAQVHENAGDYKQALEVYRKHQMVQDSLYSKENAAELAKMEAKYETKEKEKELALKSAQLKKKEAVNKQQKTQQFALIIGLFLLLGLIGVSVKNNLRRKKTNEQLSLKNQQIEEKNKAILDSFTYAQRIQRAILPSAEGTLPKFSASFIFFQPKDIVSGDLYWFEQLGDQQFFSVVDCTGHGVPGALVSVVAHNCLQRAVKEFRISEPASILDKVNELIEETFANSDREIRDGMDMSLCRFDPKTNQLSFAGAQNPIYLVREGQAKADEENALSDGTRTLYEIKGDKQPIGKYAGRTPFTQSDLELKQNDEVYLFSDGFADQFGGPKGKKFKYKPFKQLLLSLADTPMTEKGKQLEDTLMKWKGDLEQVDDVCVMGVRV